MASYPIPEHKTWAIVDSTKMQCFLDCPRRYFFEYMLGWQGEGDNVHLIFGEAWHRAMEHLLLNGYNKAAIAEAYMKLNSYYRQHFDEATDDLRAPKIPTNALNALVGYVIEYKNDEFEVLYTEIAGSVPITEKRVMHFRMDSILRWPYGIGSLEHKTGSTLTRIWMDQWLLSLQTGTYNHVLYCLYPEELIRDAGVMINGAIFNKTKTQFKRVPARRTKHMMNVWFWNIKHYFAMLEYEMERLQGCREEDDVLMAFPMNTQSCTKYFGCPWISYCMTWSNPLRYADEPPHGCTTRWWDPSDREEKPAKVVFDLEQPKPTEEPPKMFMKLEWMSEVHARLV